MSDSTSTQNNEAEDLRQPLLPRAREADQQDNNLGTESSSSNQAEEQADNSVGLGTFDNYQWEFDYKRNPGKNDKEKKIQSTYYYWTKDLKDTNNQATSRSNDMKDSWQDIYTLVGFFSVFQGVLFQVAAQLTSELSCKFSTIPVILSVLGSAASIAAAWYKLSELQEHHNEYVEAKRRAKVLNTRIKGCKEEVIKGLNKIDFKAIGKKATRAEENEKPFFDAELKRTSRVGRLLLALFFIFSGALAFSIYALICDNQF